MTNRDGFARRWMAVLTALWVLFAAGIVVFVLFAIGVFGGNMGSSDQGSAGIEESSADGNGANGGDANGEQEAGAVFSSEQASRGAEVYAQNCAQCHGGQLDGQPPLSGDAFLAKWDGMTVHALYQVISETMPLDAPGSLDTQSYEDVTAHILEANGMPAGDEELDASSDQLMQTTIGGEGATEGDGEAQDGDGQEAGADGDAEDQADAGADADAEGSDDASEQDGASLTAEEPAEGEQPGAGEGWLVLSVRPENASITVLGPAGYLGRITGGGTITGLEPGIYVVTASQGNFSHRMDAEIRQRESTRLDLVIPELSMSEDAAAGATQAPAQTSAADGADDGAQAREGSDEDAQANGDNDGGDGDSAGSSGEDGEAWYSEEQAERGAEAYSSSCASCHGQDGDGNPPLAGGAIEQSFSTVWELFDYSRTQMPQDVPGSLEDDAYVDITAHILQMNDYPAGDEELEADESAMNEMQLEGSGDTDASSGGEQADDGEGGQAPPTDEAEGEEAAPSAAERTAAGRGAALYASHCAMCHGATLAGISAPPLAGPVFMERWGGHPVEWLYYQARVSMPPQAPGSLGDEDYVDLIVFVLSENGVLEGDEEFAPLDPTLDSTIIGGPELQDNTLQQRIDTLRQTLHLPFGEAEADDPEAGADEVGLPGAETEDGEADGAAAEDGEEDEEGDEEGSDAIDPEDAEAPVDAGEGEAEEDAE